MPQVRFQRISPAENFYLRAIRFEEMFRDLIFPLRDRRSIALVMDYTEETADGYRKQPLSYTDIDVILLEGIFLLKRAFQHYYNLSIWIECSFETALERALARGQEGLSPNATIHAYRTIYFSCAGNSLRRRQPQGRRRRDSID